MEKGPHDNFKRMEEKRSKTRHLQAEQSACKLVTRQVELATLNQALRRWSRLFALSVTVFRLCAGLIHVRWGATILRL